MEIFEQQNGKKKPQAQKDQGDGSEPLCPPVAGTMIRRTLTHPLMPVTYAANQSQTVRTDEATTTDQADAFT